MNWLIGKLIKEARGRRFNPNDNVRYFTEGLKGKGKGIVLTPSFRKGRIVDYDNANRRYRVDNGEGVIDVHPRNIVPDNISPTQAPQIPQTPQVPVSTEM